MNIFERAKALKKGKVLSINQQELQEIVESISHCTCTQHKVIIENFNSGEKEKEKKKVVKFAGYSLHAKSLELTSVRVRCGKEKNWNVDSPSKDSDEIKEIPPHQVYGVDKNGNLYADLTKKA